MKKLLILFFAVLFLTACGEKKITTDQVVEAFQKAGLPAEDARDMTKDDYGIAPMLAEEAQIVKIGDDMNARIFSFEDEKDLDTTKSVYDELGKGTAWLFSWTIKHENILVQLGGDLEEEKYEEYRRVLEGL